MSPIQPSFWRMARRTPSALIGFVMVVTVLALTLWGLFSLPHDPFKANLTDRLLPPSWQTGGRRDYLLGTDPLGRDLFSRILYAGRWSVTVGVAATGLAGFIGVGLGLVAGLYGGWLDTAVVFLTNFLLAFPFVVVALVVIAFLGPNFTNIILVLGATGWTIYARVLRSETLSLREREFVLAARALGASTGRLLLRHLLPNQFDSILVMLSLQVSTMILAEAFLSFLGFGIQPPTPSWGTMIADARGRLVTEWWLAVFPGLALMFTNLGINLLGDGIRDLTDPRRRD